MGFPWGQGQGASSWLLVKLLLPDVCPGPELCPAPTFLPELRTPHGASGALRADFSGAFGFCKPFPAPHQQPRAAHLLKIHQDNISRHVPRGNTVKPQAQSEPDFPPVCAEGISSSWVPWRRSPQNKLSLEVPTLLRRGQGEAGGGELQVVGGALAG